MAEYAEIVGKEAVPIYAKLGMKLVASWHSYTGNMNESYTLFSYDDMAAYEKARVARTKSAEYQKLQARLNPLRISQTTTILEPNAWSPME